MTPPVPSSPAADHRAADRAGVAGGGGAKRYRVFLSYSHADMKWANWLLRRLEGYRVPRRFHGRAAPIGEVGGRIAPVFRDRDELPTASDLGETIRAALRESATLVVICSPAAAKSRWVREEIVAFKRLHGEARVFAFIIGGEPKAEGADDDCFSPALRATLGSDGQLSSVPVEVVAADARPEADGKEDAFIRLVAGLLGVGFDDLRQREHARRLRRMMWITGGAVAGMTLTLGLAVFAIKARNDALVARNDAQRRQERGEELLAFMLNDMKTGLLKADKLDALDEAGTRMMAYFQSLNPRDLTDKTNVQQAKALTQIGQIRIAQLRYAEASAAFVAALDRLAALVARQPDDAELLFERAQAEFWIGNVHFRRGELGPASEWFTRYRDTGVALARLDSANVRWQREAVSGHHNLAVLELNQGNLAEARNGFIGELKVLEKMSEAQPHDHELRFSIANIVSFLGTVAEQGGDYPESMERFGDQAGRLEALMEAEPRTFRFRHRLADAIGFQSAVMAISGQRVAALARRRQAQVIVDGLVVQDPANRAWQSASLNARVKVAMLLGAAGETAEATRLVRECRPLLEQLVKTETSDRTATALLASACQLDAQLRDAAGEAGAAEAAARAVAIGRTLAEQNRASESNRGDYASACVVAGLIAQRAGEAAAARRYWQTALEVVGVRGRDSTHWRLLDPAARALLLLGRAGESGAIVARLDRIGYQPLEPWPAGAAQKIPSENINP